MPKANVTLLAAAVGWFEPRPRELPACPVLLAIVGRSSGSSKGMALV